MSAQRRLRIGEVAERTETTPRTIRYYEELGLLPRSGPREPGAHRRLRRGRRRAAPRAARAQGPCSGSRSRSCGELAAAEDARAGLRREWHSGIEDPVRRREVLDEASAHIDRQLELIRRRRDAIAKLEAELVAKRRRVRDRMRELDRDPSRRS